LCDEHGTATIVHTPAGMLDPFIVMQNGSTILLNHWPESYKIVAFGNGRRCVIRVASQPEGFALSQIVDSEDE
jgi:hypothetical protein